MSLILRWGTLCPYKSSFRTVNPKWHGLSQVPVRWASLSGIHNGLRRSERARPQGSRPPKPRSEYQRGDRRVERNESSKYRDQKSDAFSDKFSSVHVSPGGRPGRRTAGGPPRDSKNKKWKKALKEPEDESGRKTRSKRFNDPENSFGKKSIVYQLNKLENVPALLRNKPGTPFDKDDSKPWLDSSSSKDSSSQSPRREPRRDYGGDRRSDSRPSRPWESEKPRYPSRDGGRGERESRFRPSSPRESGNLWQRRGQGDRNDWPPSPRGSMSDLARRARKELEDPEPKSFDSSWQQNKHADLPSTVQYTTAASQFLYGRSVVKAALQDPKRKFYHLYIYGGSNKRPSIDDEVVLALAKDNGIPTTIVPEGGQQLMERMSKGRPHNGLVLEASPLPQLPLIGLGPVSNDSRRPGYSVSVGFQSKEDAEINGTSDYIPWNTRDAKPFVLLLNEVLDPGNLGAILRSARFLGAAAVAITKQSSATLTSTVLKAAAGASEDLTIFSIDNPVDFLESSKQAGWTTYAAVAPRPDFDESRKSRQWSVDRIEEENPLLNQPCILIMGNEGMGLSKALRAAADFEVSIPRQIGPSPVDSLNVSVAAALLCNAFLKGIRQEPLSLKEQLKKDAESSAEPAGDPTHLF